jgi:hypothetical protein
MIWLLLAACYSGDLDLEKGFPRSETWPLGEGDGGFVIIPEDDTDAGDVLDQPDIIIEDDTGFFFDDDDIGAI